MMGAHNVQNSLAAIAVANELGIHDNVMRRGLAGFGGVKRRFTKTGEVNGITVIDDYGHHPVEIAAVLRAARAGTKGKVIAVVQPHRYTRLANLFEEFCGCFNDADHVIVADVYAAGETPIEGVNRDSLVAGPAHARPSPRRAAARIRRSWRPWWRELATSGDLVVCLGAGSITNWAHALPEELSKLLRQAPGRRGEVADDGRAEDAIPDRTAAGGARALHGERGAGRHHLVPRRRTGRGVVPPGRPRRSRRLPDDQARRRAGHGDRRRLQPAGARRRRAGRGDPPRPRFRRTSRSTERQSAPAPRRSISMWRSRRAMPAWPASNSSAASPAPSAARCA